MRRETLTAITDLGVRRWLALFAIWLSAAYAIAISHIQLVEPSAFSSPASPYSDAARYVGMVAGRQQPAPYRYRILVPELARRIPTGLIRRMTARPNPTPEWIAGAKIVALNIAFLSLAAAGMFALCLQLGLSLVEALIASLVFFVMRPVVQFGGIPMVDAASWVFVPILPLLALRRRYLALAATFALGMLVKETLLFSLPFVILSGSDGRERVRLTATLMPGLVLFFTIRYLLSDPRLTAVAGPWWNLTRASTYDVHPERMFSVGWLLELGSAFGLLWIPAVYEALKRDSSDLLRRWTVVPLLVLATIVVLSTNVGRIMFVAFPVMLPLAILGMQRAITRDSREPLIATQPR